MSSTAPLAPARDAAALAALVAGAATMGISPIFVRWADVGPFASAFWRVALALPALYAWTRLSEDTSSRRFSRATLLAGLAFAGDLLFWHTAILRTSVANATFFATTAPIWVIGFGWMLFGQKVGKAMLVGLGLCLMGGTALVAESLHFAPERALGDGFGLATGLFFGLYFLSVEAARRGASAAQVLFESSVVTALVLLAAALLSEARFLPSTLNGLMALLALAWISHLGGQGLLAIALGRLPASFSSLVIFLEAVFAALFALALLGEPISAAQALGGVLIMAGIFVARPR